MHISLDSALGRQRRLNSVGESVLQIAPDAAAAYSLRSLTGGDPDVVRVRRESDNTEKDFSCSQIESGEMARWVNEQPTLPLDLRELDEETGERDGALIEAAAAYSLRKLKEDFTGDVVEVRRSSDDAEESFTAAEVADGTLEDWVNTDVSIYEADWSVGVDGFSNVTGAVLSRQASVSDGTTSVSDVLQLEGSGFHGRVYKPNIQSDSDPNSHTWRVTGKYYVPSDNVTANGIAIQFDNNGGTDMIATGFVAGQGLVKGAWTDFDFTGTSSGEGDVILRPIAALNVSNGDYTGESVYFAQLEVTQVSGNGHVKTWYDQSGSTPSNDAVQTDATKQPKIVENGNLLDDGIKFEGSELMNSLNVISSTNIAIACVSKSYINGLGAICSMLDSFNDGHELLYLQNNIRYALNSSDLDVPTTVTNRNLYFANYDGSTQILSVNGTPNTSLVSETVSVSNVVQIGARAGSNLLDGAIQELIIYDSNQSDNRTAIEANIGETYGITAIPAANDTVNGYVQTWYDQSGNVPANNAVQDAAANQPKIVGEVTSGQPHAFLGAMRFDDNQFLQSSSRFTYGSGTTLSTFITNSSDGDEDAYLFTFSYDYIVFHVASGLRRVYAANSGYVSAGYVTGDKEVWTTITEISAAGGPTNFYVNGTLASAADVAVGPTAVSNRFLNIGGWAATNHWNGTVNEFILYATDQTANRPAIEANIINHYDI